jgi:membrane protein implicated in regulation of membrane protease activity
MNDWIVWLVLAGLLVILELLTGTFYLLMVAIGMAIGGMVALGGASLTMQTVAAAVASVAAIGALLAQRRRHPQGLGSPRGVDPDRDPDLNIDIGQRLRVEDWEGGQARVSYRGAPWDVELAPGAEARPGEFCIVAIKGSRLVLNNA